MESDIVPPIERALRTLQPAELHLICLAVLHGVPVRELSSAAGPQEHVQTDLITALRKLRKSLSEQGLSADELRKSFKAL